MDISQALSIQGGYSKPLAKMYGLAESAMICFLASRFWNYEFNPDGLRFQEEQGIPRSALDSLIAKSIVIKLHDSGFFLNVNRIEQDLAGVISNDSISRSASLFSDSEFKMLYDKWKKEVVIPKRGTTYGADSNLMPKFKDKSLSEAKEALRIAIQHGYISPNFTKNETKETYRPHSGNKPAISGRGVADGTAARPQLGRRNRDEEAGRSS